MAFTDYVDVLQWGPLKWLLASFIAFILFYDLFLVTRYRIRARLNGGGWIPVKAYFPLGIPPILANIQAMKENRLMDKMIARLDRFKGRSTVALEGTMSLSIFTRDPENVKSLLATDFKSYSLGRREPQLGAFLGPGIFTMSGSGWKHSRTMLRPQFTREQVAQLESLDDHVDKLIARFDENPGLFVDAQELFHQLTMDTATEFLFGESTESLSDIQLQIDGITAAQFIQSYNVAVHWSLLRIFSGPLYFLVNPKKFQQAVARARQFVEHFVDKALEATEKQVPGEESTSYFFTHELAKVTRDKAVIRDQAFNLLLAGRDTTASLLSYTLWHLGNKPEIFAKLREAVIEDFGTDSSKISFESLKRCTYLRNVINEVLRLNPIVPRNSRTAIRDTFLPHGGGEDGTLPVFVPKGTMVTYAVYDIHRNPQYWGDDAQEFNPDRWDAPLSRGWEYLPFNGGPRICLGQQFALTEASFTILRLAQEYDRVQLKDPNADLKSFVRLTANVAGGVPVILHRPRA